MLTAQAVHSCHGPKGNKLSTGKAHLLKHHSTSEQHVDAISVSCSLISVAVGSFAVCVSVIRLS